MTRLLFLHVAVILREHLTRLFIMAGREDSIAYYLHVAVFWMRMDAGSLE
jgi:hypothetical protein